MSTTNYVDVNRALELMKEQVHPENAEAIRDFVNHQAAEDISEQQQHRQVYSLRMLLTKFAPEGFRLRDATEPELKALMANLNRDENYAEGSKHKFRCTIKKFYKVENGGGEHPGKVNFISTRRKNHTTVSPEDLFSDDELRRFFGSFKSVRDRAFAMVLYESAARPGELLSRNIGDFTVETSGDFIFLEGAKNTPDRTNQLIRSGKAIRAWLAQHPLGGEVGNIKDPSAPLWVKTTHQKCRHCGSIPYHHDDSSCEYEPDLADRMNYHSYLRRFKDACERADIPKNKRRPYNLRHTRLTEVAKFMGYEQLNKFGGWVPGSDRAKVYVHLTSEDVNEAIRDHYGLRRDDEDKKTTDCPFCETPNQSTHAECRKCGRPLSLKHLTNRDSDQRLIQRLKKLEEMGMLDKLEQLEDLNDPSDASSQENQGVPSSA